MHGQQNIEDILICSNLTIKFNPLQTNQ